MDADRSLRFEAARSLAHALWTEPYRRLFDANGYKSGQEILVALEGDSVADVLRRAKNYTPPVTVAVYFPVTSELMFAEMRPQATPGAESLNVRNVSTIGMLCRYLSEHAQNEKHRQRFNLRVTDWDFMAVREFEPA